MNDSIVDAVPMFNVSDSGDGVHTVGVRSHEQFTQLLGERHFLDHPEYVFRGHVNPSWELLPSLYRRFEKTSEARLLGDKEMLMTQRQHAGIKTASVLRHFLQGLRRTAWHEPHHELLLEWFAGAGPSPHIDELRKASNEHPALWTAAMNTWALGQHHRLTTPLLDWSESALVAFYFAFERSDDRRVGQESRAVYALNRRLVEARCAHAGFDQAPLGFVSTYSRTSQRLIAQQGLFTYSHVYQSVEDWVRDTFKGEQLPVLIRFLIHDAPTQTAVRWLNRHGINDRTLFPDVEGAALFANRCFDDNTLHSL